LDQVQGLDFGKLFSNNLGMDTQQSKRGGKREGAGRKPKTEAERLSEVFSLKLTIEEKRLLDETEARGWARKLLVSSAKRRLGSKSGAK
jgi:hypothetical protein